MNLFRTSSSQKNIIGIVLIITAIAWLFPLYSAVERSLMGEGIKNFWYVFTTKIGGVSIYRAYFNSFLIAGIKCALVVIISTSAAFAYSKLEFVGKKVLYLFSIIFLSVPLLAIVTPLFRIINILGIYDTYWAVIITELVLELPFGVLMMKNFYDSLPDEFMEAASIDGAGYFKTYWYVYIPMSIPALINLIVLTVMWSIKDFIVPTLFTTSKELTTATLAVSKFNDALSTTPIMIGRYNASIVVLAIPIIILFSYIQKHLVGGFISGSIK